MSKDELVLLHQGVRFLRAQTLELGLKGLAGLVPFVLAVCVEAALAPGVPSRTIKVDVDMDTDDEAENDDQLGGEMEALMQAWRLVSASMSQLPGLCRVVVEAE